MNRIEHLRTTLGWSGLLSGALLISTAAQAQEISPQTAPRSDAASPQEGKSETNADGVEDIIVTASKRAENLQRVPVAITAFSSARIEQTRIQGVQDIAIQTPGFVVGQRNPADRDLTIRGIGSNDPHAGSDRSVLLYVDDVVVSRSGGAPFDLFDLDRIEVLRGPQGTLAGRNAVGGAVYIYTRRPTATPSASVQVGFGNYNTIEGRAMASGPLTDSGKVLGKIVASSRSSDGFNRSIRTGKTVGDTDSLNIRGQLLFKPSDDIDLLLSGEVGKESNNGNPIKTSPAGTLFAGIGFTPNPDPFLIDDDYIGGYKRDYYGMSSRLDWRLGDITFTSITGYNDYRYQNDVNLTGAPLDSSFNTAGQPRGFRSVEAANESSNQFTQEVRLTSGDDGPLKWVTGIYYFRERTRRVVRVDRSLNASASKPVFDQRAAIDSYSAYVQGTYAITNALNLTLGGRYTRDEKTIGILATDASNGTLVSVAPAIRPINATTGLPIIGSLIYDTTGNPARDAWEAFTPKITIDWNVNNNALLYATASKGFKSGGFLGVAATAADARTSFSPETAWNYEIGAKTRWFDDHLQINLAAFMMDFQDLQVRSRVLAIPGNQASAISVIRNVGSAKVKGIEAEMIAVPVRGLTLTANYSYLDTELRNFLIQSGASFVNASGFPLPRAPRHSFTLGASYAANISDNLKLSSRLDYNYRSKFFFDEQKTPAGLEPAYGLLSGRIAIQTRDDAWELALWGKNLTNQTYRVFVQPLAAAPPATGSGLSTFGTPRTYGVSLTWRYK